MGQNTPKFDEEEHDDCLGKFGYLFEKLDSTSQVAAQMEVDEESLDLFLGCDADSFGAVGEQVMPIAEYLDIKQRLLRLYRFYAVTLKKKEGDGSKVEDEGMLEEAGAGGRQADVVMQEPGEGSAAVGGV